MPDVKIIDANVVKYEDEWCRIIIKWGPTWREESEWNWDYELQGPLEVAEELCAAIKRGVEDK